MAVSPRIVLVRTRNPLNIGAAARAMANFGLDDLVLVEPYSEAWKEARSARAGVTVLEQARTVASLPEALSGCSLVVGTTDGAKRVPDLPLEDWQTLAPALSASTGHVPAAVVFGPENHGLGVDDISHCNRLARIETAPEAPSMNLGQAVALCCHDLARLSRGAAAAPPKGRSHAAISAPERERILEIWYPILEQIEAVHRDHRESQTRALREMLVRWQLSPKDERRLLGLARQVRHALRLAGIQKPKGG